ncbi:MAG TPA: NUDIX domain-containing protein [bacterium]|nr:NUDIX domain-containing protein [bacterium]HPS29111.1 NUDIX domain-containing protein [bacterium]
MNFRKNVAAVIINSDNLILVGERRDIKNAWQIPQGGVDEGEDEATALFREIKEETGIERNYLKILANSDPVSYFFPNRVNRRFGFDGQLQTYFLLEIKESGWDLKPSKEFISFDWITKEEAIKRVVDFKKNSYIKAFGQLFGDKR